MNLNPILTPPGWTPEKDFQDYEDRFGEAEDYFADALSRVADCYQELIEAVDSALDYFQDHDHRLTPVHPGTLTLGEKIYQLSIITNVRNDSYPYKHRFAMHLHNCLWVDAERRRVMQGYYLGEEKTWLYPWPSLPIPSAAPPSELEEAMSVEHKDYKK